MCEGCGLKVPTCGLASEGKMRWCAGCGEAEGAVRLQKPKMCEGCGLKQPTCGLASEGKIRWCAGCGAAEGAVSLQKRKMCLEKRPRGTASVTAGAGAKQDARSVRARGVLGGHDNDSDGDEVRRAGEAAVVGAQKCAKAEEVEAEPTPALEPEIKRVPSNSRQQQKQQQQQPPTCVWTATRRAVWASLQNPKMCEGCGVKQMTCGLASEGKMRWCAGCGPAEGAVRLQKRKMCLEKRPRGTASVTAGAGAKQGARSVRARGVWGGHDTDSDGDKAPRAEEAAVVEAQKGAKAEEVEAEPTPALEPEIKRVPSNSRRQQKQQQPPTCVWSAKRRAVWASFGAARVHAEEAAAARGLQSENMCDEADQ
jgi:hypothetical protein